MSSVPSSSVHYHAVSGDNVPLENKEKLKKEKNGLILQLVLINSVALAILGSGIYMIHAGNEAEHHCYTISNCTSTGNPNVPWHCPNGNPCIEAGAPEGAFGYIFTIVSSIGGIIYDVIKANHLSRVFGLLKTDIGSTVEAMKQTLEVDNTPINFPHDYNSPFNLLIEFTIFTKEDQTDLFRLKERYLALKRTFQNESDIVFDSHFSAVTRVLNLPQTELDVLVDDWRDFKQQLLNRLPTIIVP